MQRIWTKLMQRIWMWKNNCSSEVAHESRSPVQGSRKSNGNNDSVCTLPWYKNPIMDKVTVGNDNNMQSYDSSSLALDSSIIGPTIKIGNQGHGDCGYCILFHFFSQGSQESTNDLVTRVAMLVAAWDFARLICRSFITPKLRRQWMNAGWCRVCGLMYREVLCAGNKSRQNLKLAAASTPHYSA